MPCRKRPWLLRALLKQLSVADRRALQSELDELYRHREAQAGRAAADRWYRRQARRTVSFQLANALVERTPRPEEIMPDLMRSIRYALRRLLCAPAFTLAAVITLALGIGAASTVFAVVDGVLLKPLPFDEPDRLVGLWHTWPGQGLEAASMAPALYFSYREQNRVFEEVGMWDTGSVTVTGIDDPERVDVISVTDGTLSLLRVAPALGRLFSRADDSPGAPLTTMISHDYWQERFGADPDIVGRMLTIDGRAIEIIGVTPATLHFLDYDPALFLPFRFDRSEVYIGNFSFQGIARLHPGVTLAEANADVARMIPIAAETFPGTDYEILRESGFGPLVRPLDVDVVGDVGNALWIVFATVGLVLVLACANVANLILARAESGQVETAIRAALGAGRARLLRESIVEVSVLSLAGGAVGLAAAMLGIRALVAAGPEGLPRLDEIAIDVRVAIFAGIAVGVAALLAATVPLVRVGKTSPIGAMVGAGRGRSSTVDQHRTRNALVVCQMAIAVMLVVGSVLLVRSFDELRRVDPGFRGATELLTLRLSIPTVDVPDAEAVARQHEQILGRIEAIAGIESVALTSSVTMDGWDSNDSTEFEGFPIADDDIAPSRRYKWVSPGYFETMENPLLAGRTFDWTDVWDRADVALITEDLAVEYWDSPAEALGRRLRESRDSPWREIVGVVGNIRDDGVSRPSRPTVFWPMLMRTFWATDDFSRRSMVYVVRSSRVGTPELLDEIRAAVRAINPSLPLADVRTMEELVGASMARTSFTLVMLAIAAGVALLLGTVGIYGVTAYVVSLRTHEIGVRMALGAEAGQIRRMVLRHATLLAGLGVCLGTLGAVGLARLMAALLYGVGSFDVISHAVAIAGVCGVSLLASYWPARRAARVQPTDALRR